MRSMFILTTRVIKLFFRDRIAVFFSFLSSFIIIVLYIVFLGHTYTSSIPQIQDASQLMNQWVMAGILATSSVSTTIATFSIMVDDRIKTIEKDFLASPIHRNKIMLSYYIAGLLVGYLLSLLTFLFAQIYILLNGGTWFHFSTFIKILLAFIIIVIMNGSMMFCITSFFKSHHAFSTAMTLVGTLSGFMTGIYIPIGSLPVSLQWVIKLFPTSHGAVLLRQIMMETSLLETFQNIPHSFLEHFKESFGIVYSFGQVRLTPLFHIIYLFIFILLFLGMGIYVMKRMH